VSNHAIQDAENTLVKAEPVMAAHIAAAVLGYVGGPVGLPGPEHAGPVHGRRHSQHRRWRGARRSRTADG
jgi:hypothetical protein